MPTYQSNRGSSRARSIAISMGDPSGVGPEVILKALDNPKIKRLAHFLVVGDAFVLEKAAATVLSGRKKRSRSRKEKSLTLSMNQIEGVRALHKELRGPGGRLGIKDREPGFLLVDMQNVKRKTFGFGKLRPSYGAAAIEYITKAVELIEAGLADGLVTAPINKEAIARAGLKWEGHTEYLAHLTKQRNFAMMLIGGPLRVVPVTRHLSLKKVATALNSQEIYTAIKLTHQTLRSYFKIKNPRIGVCSLNPHGGEGGIFGDEEARIIRPAVERAGRQMRYIFGPLPADALFYLAYKGNFDAVIVMYHDQGLIPLKMVARDLGANVTLGLPFFRTSPSHGTGFDIAGKGIANPASMIEAIKFHLKT